MSYSLILVVHLTLCHIPCFQENLSSFELRSAYVSWFHSYLTDRFSSVIITGIISAPFRILASVSQGSVLGPLLFNIYIDDTCNVITHSRFLLFSDDTKILHAIKSFDDSNYN
jgi:hypothetical protein